MNHPPWKHTFSWLMPRWRFSMTGIFYKSCYASLTLFPSFKNYQSYLENKGKGYICFKPDLTNTNWTGLFKAGKRQRSRKQLVRNNKPIPGVFAWQAWTVAQVHTDPALTLFHSPALGILDVVFNAGPSSCVVPLRWLYPTWRIMGCPPQSVPLLHCPQGKQLMWALPIKQKNLSRLAMKLYHFLWCSEFLNILIWFYDKIW